MIIKGCFIDTRSEKRNIYIPIKWEERNYYIKFTEIVPSRIFGVILNSKEFKDFPKGIKNSNIMMLIPYALEQKTIEKTNDLENNFETLFVQDDKKNKDLYIELTYSEEYKNFLNKILNSEVMDWEEEIETAITFFNSKNSIEKYIEEIHKIIKEVVIEIDSIL